MRFWFCYSDANTPESPCCAYAMGFQPVMEALQHRAFAARAHMCRPRALFDFMDRSHLCFCSLLRSSRVGGKWLTTGRSSRSETEFGP